MSRHRRITAKAMECATSEWWFKHYSREVCSAALLSPEEEIQTARLIITGCEKARERMICANVRLVLKMAMGMKRQGHSLYDLAAEGTKGLIFAVDRYDPERGVRFATYAVHWIRQSIRRYIENNTGPLRTPVHTQQRAFRLNKVASDMAQRLGHEPTSEELALELGLDSEDVDRILHWRPSTLPLDSETADGTPLSEIIPEEADSQWFAGSDIEDAKAALVKAIGTLRPQERKIIIRRFGLDGDEPETLDNIGQSENLTRERIRQIQEKALRKLRNAGNWPISMFQELQEHGFVD